MDFLVYFSITLRFFGALFICPLFSENLMPKTIKMILALLFACLVMPRFMEIRSPSIPILGLLNLSKEVIIGFIIGYGFSFPIWLIENIGNLIDMQRGEQLGAITNQLTKNPASSISRLMLQSFIVYFMSIGGIAYFISLIAHSFLVIGPMQFFPTTININGLIKLFSQYYYLLVILAIPVLLAMYLLELILGLFSSFIPQLNVTVLSMPLKSILALLVLTLCLGSIYHYTILRFVNEEILNLFKN